MPYFDKATTPLQRLQEQLQAVDVLFEVRDARLPDTSTHPKTKELFGSKPRVIVFCKEDLADPVLLRQWVRQFNNDKERGIALSLKLSKGKKQLLSLATELCKDKLASRAKKGLLPRPLRAAVVGLPNVGKSSLINWTIGKKKAQVANTPGVTKSNNWIRIDPQIELLDTPGMLPLAAFKGTPAMKLSLCNVLPGEQYDNEEIAVFGLKLVSELYPNYLQTYGKGNDEFQAETCSLEDVARARSCLRAGGQPDIKRAAGIFLSEFRNGKLGRMVLDHHEGDGVDEDMPADTEMHDSNEESDNLSLEA